MAAVTSVASQSATVEGIISQWSEISVVALVKISDKGLPSTGEVYFPIQWLSPGVLTCKPTESC